jgi:hypothetical protein
MAFGNLRIPKNKFFKGLESVLMCWANNGKVFAVGEGGDFYHTNSYESPIFEFSKNCHTKHRAANFAKPVLAEVFLAITL